MSKNIGGSILPSSCPEIMQPIRVDGCELRVVEDPLHDTHHLVRTKAGRAAVIASHQNGYSCHALAVRMASGNSESVADQAEYICRCGGMVDREAFKPRTN